MRESGSSIVRRVNVDALDLTGELLFERFEGEEVVAEDETIVEKIVVSHAVRSVIGLFRVLQQNARLQLGPVLFANPGEFEFLLAGHGYSLPLYFWWRQGIVDHLKFLSVERDKKPLPSRGFLCFKHNFGPPTHEVFSLMPITPT